MKNTIDVGGHSLVDLERAIATLRAAGAPDDSEVRVRISSSFSADGGYPKRLTGRWKPSEQH